MFQVLQYMADGAYLDKLFSLGLDAKVVTFNAEAGVFGFWEMKTDWTGAGHIPAKFQVKVSLVDLCLILAVPLDPCTQRL